MPDTEEQNIIQDIELEGYTNKYIKHYIEDEDIKQIPYINVFDNKDLNNKLVKLHKKLLNDAKSANDSNEMAYAWEYIKNDNIEWQLDNDKDGYIKTKGSEYNVNIPKIVYDSNTPSSSIVVIHNHPGNGTFSDDDIDAFISLDTIKVLSAVGNNGTDVRILLKKDNFDAIKAFEIINEAYRKNLYGKYKSLRLACLIDHQYIIGVSYKYKGAERGIRL